MTSPDARERARGMAEDAWDLAKDPEAFDDAEAKAREALEVDAGCARAHALLGQLLYEQLARGATQDVAAVENHLREAHRLDPFDGESMVYLAEYFRRTGRGDDALLELEDFVEARPENALGHWGLARLLDEHSGETERAEQHFARAAELDPEHPGILYSYALFLAGRNRLTDALSLLAQAEQLGHKRSSALLEQLLARLRDEGGA